MELEELTSLLHTNKQVTPDVGIALEYHATALSKSICDEFTVLNAIIVRHEALISKRWHNKTVAKRREIILGAWPDMHRYHRPDLREDKYSAVRPRTGTILDDNLWLFGKLLSLAALGEILMCIQSTKKILSHPRSYRST